MMSYLDLNIFSIVCDIAPKHTKVFLRSVWGDVHASYLYDGGGVGGQGLCLLNTLSTLSQICLAAFEVVYSLACYYNRNM